MRRERTAEGGGRGVPRLDENGAESIYAGKEVRGGASGERRRGTMRAMHKKSGENTEQHQQACSTHHYGMWERKKCEAFPAEKLWQ